MNITCLYDTRFVINFSAFLQTYNIKILTRFMNATKIPRQLCRLNIFHRIRPNTIKIVKYSESD